MAGTLKHGMLQFKEDMGMTDQQQREGQAIESPWVPFFYSAVLFTFFLFFIDEGYYNFKWMTNPGNWIMFVNYVSIFFSSQFIISQLIFRKQQGIKKTLYSILGGGVFLGMIIILVGMFIAW